ncbi:MAG: hypothetical protein OXC64_00385 [Flavobacteriaceae bacterium]|nr:hypothetical protein [Flavobacteriaceae bacterium]
MIFATLVYNSPRNRPTEITVCHPSDGGGGFGGVASRESKDAPKEKLA